MQRKIILPLALLCISAANGFSQMKIGTAPTVINGGSVLELESTTQGLYLPRVSLSATGTWGLSGIAPNTLVNGGMMVYNINAGITGTGASGMGIYYWNADPTTPLWVYLKNGGNKQDWSLTGNAGTVAGTNFIGTTDAIDWEVKTFGTERMRVKATGDLVIGANDSTATATGGIFRAGNISAGTTNTVGPDFLFYAGNGTGNKGSGSITFSTAPKGASGTAVDVIKERMRVTNDGSVNINTIVNIASNDLLGSQGDATFIYPINGYGTTSAAIAVYGSNSSTGLGVLGIQGNGATGLLNPSTFVLTNAGGAFQGIVYGAYCQSDPVNSAGAGVAGVGGFGSTTATTGAFGVYGTYDYATTNLDFGVGVLGVGDGGTLPSGTAADYGVVGTIGTTKVTTGAGVAGYSGTITAPNITNLTSVGVYGSTSSTSNFGVYSNGAMGAALNGGIAGVVSHAVLSLKNGHLQSQQTTAPTIASNTGTPSISNATDIAGKVKIIALGTTTTITTTFNTSYATAPIVVITPNDAATATIMVSSKIFVTSTTNTFVINFGAAAVAATYNFSYHVIETQ